MSGMLNSSTMARVLAPVLGVLLLSCTALQAEIVTNPMRVLKNERCAGGAGFFLWDSRRCLLENDSIFVNGKAFKLTHQVWKIAYQRKRRINSVGDRERVTYRAGRFNVQIDLTYLPGCDYSFDQCTFRNYHASFRLLYPDGTLLQFQGVGYSGS